MQFNLVQNGHEPILAAGREIDTERGNLRAFVRPQALNDGFVNARVRNPGWLSRWQTLQALTVARIDNYIGGFRAHCSSTVRVNDPALLIVVSQMNGHRGARCSPIARRHQKAAAVE